MSLARALLATGLTVSLSVLSPAAALASNASDWPDLDNPAASQGTGSRDAAVVIGVEDYVFAPDIAGADSNAEAWYRHLTKTRGVPAQNVRLLRNEEATLEEMRTAAKEAAKLVGKDGTVWFVFIGHGAPSRDGNDGLLVGSDAQQTATSLEARSLRRSELIQTLEGGAGQPIVVIDACFSGRGQQGEQLAEGLQPLRVADLAPPKSALVLTAAKSNQYAGSLPGKDVPAFSYLLLGAMRGWGDADGNGTVTAAEANQYASGAMRATIKGRSQTPELGGPSGTVLAMGDEAGPDLSAIVLAGPGRPAGRDVDNGSVAPLPAPATDAEGQMCTDTCPDGTTCTSGVCRLDHAAITKREKRARGMMIGGGVTMGIGAALTIGAGVMAAGEAGEPGPVIGLGAAGILVMTVGGAVLGAGSKRRKEARALRGQYSFAPTLSGDRNSAMLGLQGHF